MGFNHYSDEDSAREKWTERKQRIDYSKIYIIIATFDGLSDLDMERAHELITKGIARNVVVLASENAEGMCDIKIKGWNEANKSDGLFRFQKKGIHCGLRLFEYQFDFIRFLNDL